MRKKEGEMGEGAGPVTPVTPLRGRNFSPPPPPGVVGQILSARARTQTHKNSKYPYFGYHDTFTLCVDGLPHMKWKETKQQPCTDEPGNMLGCCLVSFHFLWGKLSTRTVDIGYKG